MSRRFRYSVIALFVIAAMPGYVGLFWNQHNQEITQRNQQAAQTAARHAADLVELRLCTTLVPLEPLASLIAPAGNPAANPSRAYEQKLTRLLHPLAQLGPDLGCKTGAP